VEPVSIPEHIVISTPCVYGDVGTSVQKIVSRILREELLMKGIRARYEIENGKFIWINNAASLCDKGCRVIHSDCLSIPDNHDLDLADKFLGWGLARILDLYGTADFRTIFDVLLRHGIAGGCIHPRSFVDDEVVMALAPHEPSYDGIDDSGNNANASQDRPKYATLEYWESSWVAYIAQTLVASEVRALE
jgi:hypothetical protein